jgi:hypothetical protein
MTEMLWGIVGSLIVAVLLGIGAIIGRFARKRIKFTNPQSAVIEEIKTEVSRLATIVRCIFRVQKPQIEALNALLEATKGEINGNVDTALAEVKKAKIEFNDFITDSISRPKDI